MMEVKLPDVCRLQYGFAFDSAQFSTTTGTPLVRIRDILRGYSETYTTETCSDEYIVDNGDLLIGMDGEFNIARWQGSRALLNQPVCRLIPSSKIDADYLYYFMPQALKRIENQTPFVTEMYCVKGGFTTQIHIGWRFICGRMTEAEKAVIDQQERSEAGASGDGLGAPFSLPALCEERTYSPPASGRWYCLRQSCALRGAARRAALPCPVWTGQQTPPAACASGGAAPMHWGLGGHRPPTSCAGYIPGHCLLLLSAPIKEC